MGPCSIFNQSSKFDSTYNGKWLKLMFECVPYNIRNNETIILLTFLSRNRCDKQLINYLYYCFFLVNIFKHMVLFTFCIDRCKVKYITSGIVSIFLLC